MTVGHLAVVPTDRPVESMADFSHSHHPPNTPAPDGLPWPSRRRPFENKVSTQLQMIGPWGHHDHRLLFPGGAVGQLC